MNKEIKSCGEYPNHGRSRSMAAISKGKEHLNSSRKLSDIVTIEDDPSWKAVEIRDLHKCYKGGPPILENLNMNVQKGTIYGLLGSSGCGKTTLLSCIVGLRKWDAGEVLVFGHKPGTKESGIPGRRLGYMPQDLALYDQLSVREMMQFFARLYNMTSTEAAERWFFLVHLLKLPTKFSRIGNLSGGQKRRASLALALFHCPELLILDEPTVGLDPLLRRNIWNHLYKIVTTLNTTIIVTTHYIEESRLANKIGVMRKGRLLVEDSPSNLLRRFRCHLLEDVVLRLCRRDELVNNSTSTQTRKITPTSSIEENEPVVFKSFRMTDPDDIYVANDLKKAVSYEGDINDNLKVKEEQTPEMPQESVFLRVRRSSIYESIQRIYGVATVMWLTFFRSPIFLSLLLLLPSMNGILTVLIIGTKPYDLPFGVVNLEKPDWAEACHLATNSTDKCDVSLLSCTYLNLLTKSPAFNLIPQSSEEKAVQEVHQGKLWGYLAFPANFSQDTIDMIVARQFAFNESIEGSRIPVRMDITQFAGAMLMVKELYAIYADYLWTVANSCGIGGSETEIPLFFRQPVYGNNSDNFTEFILPGLIVLSTFAVILCLTAILIIQDRRLGMLSRVYVAGLGDSEMMISHMITQGWTVLLQVAIYTLFFHLFGFDIEGSGLLYTVILLGTGICAAVLGISLAAVTTEEVEVIIFAMMLFPTMIIYSGAVWPPEGLPLSLKILTDILPASIRTVTSLRSVVTRGVGITHATVWPGLISLGCWLVVGWLISVFAIRKISKQ